MINIFSKYLILFRGGRVLINRYNLALSGIVDNLEETFLLDQKNKQSNLKTKRYG